MNKVIIGVIVVFLIGVASYFLFFRSNEFEVGSPEQDAESVVVEPVEVTEPIVKTEEVPVAVGPVEVIGTSVDGNAITAYHYGEGDKELLFVGGIHGSYGWNTSLVAYELMDYIKENPDIIPENVKVTVIPVLNPDGLDKVIGTTGRFKKTDVTASLEDTIPGRFNANNVDLNRNFDCDWQASGKWQDRTVSGGNKAFSEPESKAIQTYVNTNNPTAVVAWYSAAGGVFASNCHNGILPKTLTMTDIYANASGYKAFETFDFYEVTGDMVNWLASKGIPAISVLLTTHTDTEWNKNKLGINALFEYYAK